MRTCKCGRQVASNAKFCPNCGHRLTSLLTWAIAAFFLFCALLGVAISASRPTPQQPEPAKSAQQVEDENYASAQYVCEEWTEKNSKLSVAKVTDEFRRSDHHKNDGTYNVGLRYIGKEMQVLMRSDCSVHIGEEKLVIVRAKSYVVQ